MLFSCGENKSERDMLHEEVMDIHDEVMPEMSSLRRLTKALEQRADSLAAAGMDSAALQSILMTAKEVDSAKKGMMDWMYEFRAPDEDVSDSAAIVYYNEQKVLITNVKDDMLSAKSNGERVLEETGGN